MFSAIFEDLAVQAAKTDGVETTVKSRLSYYLHGSYSID
jgi:hypothetical protein